MKKLKTEAGQVQIQGKEPSAAGELMVKKEKKTNKKNPTDWIFHH